MEIGYKTKYVRKYDKRENHFLFFVNHLGGKRTAPAIDLSLCVTREEFWIYKKRRWRWRWRRSAVSSSV